jgi:transposase
MGAPTPLWVRQRVIEDWQAGHAVSTIVERHGLSRSSVYNMCRRYKEKGIDGLIADYSACGRPRAQERIYRAARFLRFLHRDWGAPLIRTVLEARYAGVPGTRTLQRWFKAAGLSTPRQKRPASERAKADQVHGCWQIDAKERLPAKASYLSIVDEHSGAFIEAPVFPLRTHQPGAPAPDAA